MFGLFRSNGEWDIRPASTAAKFPEDNLSYNGERADVFCEGYILNSENSTGADVHNLFCRKDDKLYTGFLGSYVIAAVDRETGDFTLFNDLLSKKAVYFYRNDELFCFSTSFLELVEWLKQNGFTLSVDEAGVRSMLHSGYMLENMTYANEIKYLMPFQAVRSGEIIDLPIPEPDAAVSPEQAVDRLDELFCEGCRLQLEKNRSAGYRQVFSLSGGMDSRALILTAKRLGYSPDQCFTYSESGSKDDTISHTIAKDLGCDFLFYPMDGGGFLADRECRAMANEGMLAYSGTTGLMEVVPQLDCSSIGIVGAGIGGGEIMGDSNMLQPGPAAGRQYMRRNIELLGISSSVRAKELTDAVLARYSDCNQYANLREMRVCVNFARTASGYFEVASPFLYEPFFTYALSLPAEMRTNRKLYRQWYDKYMPNSYETTFRPNDAADVRLTLWRRALRKASVIAKKFSSDKKKGKNINQMNPFEYWWSSNPELRDAVNNLWRDDMLALSGKIDPVIDDALRTAYAGNFSSKLFALTASWSLRKLF